MRCDNRFSLDRRKMTKDTIQMEEMYKRDNQREQI